MNAKTKALMLLSVVAVAAVAGTLIFTKQTPQETIAPIQSHPIQSKHLQQLLLLQAIIQA